MTTPTLQIDTFESRHRDAFRRLNMHWLEKYFRVEPIDEFVLGEPERAILEPGGEILFARIDAAIVGTVALKREDEHTFELTKMAVDDLYQGRGYGRRLLEAAVELARRRGARRLILYTHSSLAAAVALYRSCGFVEYQSPCDGRYARCDLTMRREL